MTQTRFAALFAVAVGEGVAALALIFRSNHEHHQISTSALAVTAGISFVAAGLIALRRRPENRTGIYLAAVGYLWFISALSESNNQWVYTAGLIVSNFVFVPFGALVLAFPSGRLTTRVDRWILRGTVVFALFGQLSDALVNSRGMANCKGICPTSAIVIFDSHSTAVVVESVFTLVGLVLLALVVGVLVVRWRRARPTMRRVLLPVYLAGGGALFVLLLLNIISEISTPVAEGLNPIFLVMFAAIPFAFLLGILRSRLAQGSVATLVVAIGQGTSLRDAIADALGDPSLELAYWLGDDARYVDRDGRAFALPEAGSGRSATIVQRDSTRVGAIVHDDSLDDERELVVERRSRGRPRTRQRAAANGYPHAVRPADDDRRHGAEPADHDRPRGPHRQPQPRDAPCQRLRRSGRGARQVLLGRLHRRHRARSDDRALPARGTRFSGLRVRERVPKRAW